MPANFTNVTTEEQFREQMTLGLEEACAAHHAGDAMQAIKAGRVMLTFAIGLSQVDERTMGTINAFIDLLLVQAHDNFHAGFDAGAKLVSQAYTEKSADDAARKAAAERATEHDSLAVMDAQLDAEREAQAAREDAAHEARCDEAGL